MNTDICQHLKQMTHIWGHFNSQYLIQLWLPCSGLYFSFFVWDLLVEEALCWIYMSAKLIQLCLMLCDPMDHSLPGSSVHEILRGRILEWVAMPSSGGSFRPRDQTRISYVFCMIRWVLLPLAPDWNQETHWIRESFKSELDVGWEQNIPLYIYSLLFTKSRVLMYKT